MPASTLELAAVILGGSGVLGTIVTLLKVKPDVARVTVSAAEGAVIVQTAVIASLRDELARVYKERSDYREECEEKAEQVRSLQAALNAINERKTKLPPGTDP